MRDRSDQVLQDALALPPAERAELIEHVLACLDTPARREIDRDWAAEAEDRLDAYERGEMPTVSARKVFDNFRQRKH